MLLILIFNSRKNKLYSNGSFRRNDINKKKKNPWEMGHKV